MGIEIWERVARLSQGLGYRRQALYCLTKAITGAPRNPSARWTKCNLLLEMGLNQEVESPSPSSWISSLRLSMHACVCMSFMQRERGGEDPTVSCRWLEGITQIRF